MVLVYVSSTLLWAYPLEEVLERSHRLGFQGVEIWAEHLWYYDSKPADICKLARQLGLSLSLHAASWDLNPCSLNSGIRRASLLELSRSLVLADQLGAKNVTVHPGRLTLTAEWLDWHREVLIDSFSILAKEAMERELTLSIEHIEPIKREFIVTPVEVNRLLEAIPYPVATTFDIAHVPLDRSALRFYQELSSISKIHISDATLQRLHLPLGAGEIELTSILPTLFAAEQPVVVEGIDFSKQLEVLQANIRYLQTHHPNVLSPRLESKPI
ncbi:sugar phosphate isomerase/epimerase [Brevibacillus humidisoli]|uniref:sugar phosphate isomerase/epimerase family protein n=1 Tax=Brevibacillus humidisoli TaxID=2895522 RepID=UPI001E5A5F61|nr:sugar phosphate isomerase/epimerase family protein [Brevibacillus humidisoli]UFJ38915.1 sugar phosphate isomerase/epimerase [Brevibacillus humidisoli]